MKNKFENMNTGFKEKTHDKPKENKKEKVGEYVDFEELD